LVESYIFVEQASPLSLSLLSLSVAYSKRHDHTTGALLSSTLQELYEPSLPPLYSISIFF
jgi:hypothetical protein